MDEGDTLRRRDRGFESGMHGAHGFIVLFGRNEIPALLPSGHLSLDEAQRSTQIAEVTALRLDPMEIRHGVD